MNRPVNDPTKLVPDATKPYRSLIAGYTESIRASDFKANIAFLFVMFSMSPILWNYTSLPRYLPVQLVLVPFVIVYFCMFMVLLPRYPKRGAKNFLVARNLNPEDFDYVVETEDDIEQLKLRCAILSDILWWKTQSMRIGFLLSIACIVLTIFLLIYIWIT